MLATTVQFDSDTQRDFFVRNLAFWLQNVKTDADNDDKWIADAHAAAAFVNLLDNEQARLFLLAENQRALREQCAEFMLWLLDEYPHLIG